MTFLCSMNDYAIFIIKYTEHLLFRYFLMFSQLHMKQYRLDIAGAILEDQHFCEKYDC